MRTFPGLIAVALLIAGCTTSSGGTPSGAIASGALGPVRPWPRDLIYLVVVGLLLLSAALVARIRHEINTPLPGVLGQAQLLLREDLSERSRKRVQTIEDLALRLRDIVGQLREVQRPGGDGETSE